ncbi:ribonuclease HIII [candidate division WOR-3 bacterium]|nr:ribonuclease HIII [candidate division WOR-3 bacterium]
MNKFSRRELVQKIKENLKKTGAELSGEKEILRGTQFFVKSRLGSGHVRVYDNKKKGVRLDLSQIDSEDLVQFIENFEGNPEIQPENLDLQHPFVGCDESGKGDLFGPLVSAAFFADEEDSCELERMGVRDSKMNTDEKNIALAQNIGEAFKSKFEITVLSPMDYNEKYEQVKRKGYSLNELLCDLHKETVRNLAKRHLPRTLIVDKFSRNCDFSNVFHGKTSFFYRAESIRAVAAASVLARSAFLGGVKIISEKYGMKIPLGCSAGTHKTALKFAENFGEKELRMSVKMNFKTAQQVLRSIRPGTIFDSRFTKEN